MRTPLLLALGLGTLHACSPASSSDPDPAPTVTPTEIRLLQEGGSAWWRAAVLEPAAEAAENVPEDELPEEWSPEDRELAALATLAAASAEAATEPGAPGWRPARGALTLSLTDRPERDEPTAGDRAPFASRDTRDRIRMDLVLSLGSDGADPHELRLEPLRAIRAPDDPDRGSIAVDARRTPLGWTGWMLANVVVDGRTLDTDHLVHVSARPSGATAPVEPGSLEPPAPLYAVQLVVMPVAIGGTVPELDPLEALQVLGLAQEEASTRQVLHLVLPEARIAQDPIRG